MIHVFAYRYFPDYVGGGERLAELTVRGLRQLGQDCAVVTTSGVAGETSVWDDVQIHHIAPKGDDGFDTEALTRLIALDQPQLMHITGSLGAYDAALRYSKLRKQFSRPISEFQAIQHKLVDMALDIDAARLLNYRAAWMLDRGQRVTRESAMSKLFASEAAVRIANEAVQIHGGYGFIKDYPVEKFYRDVKLCTIGEGTSEIRRMVIARQLLKS